MPAVSKRKRSILSGEEDGESVRRVTRRTRDATVTSKQRRHRLPDHRRR